ncbi:MAG: ABC transporter substrate-binding protein [Rhodospirillales bacterium]|jgi:microcin C transport system substrate-binding protein|nr:ABC transporter substrate-binding protein [Rhodospirillales bacterium]MBT4041704.1 ABC transporter substrate-binding protein [Rhodospirillales bacterium]MBT4626946.1 ABC transporter substrate-binding protein [Rhodospirillales bacterium]MBT5350175.1 ABC transporter substrate-binding protein [Rhodospirillales bacterium]MBT5521077.1 ABC transporter substrate-binding protein [Rhodospirillales bacterium]
MIKKAITTLSVLVMLTTVSVGGAVAGEDVTTSHGIAMHGDLKYSVDFTNFDYVNPDAPKGGLVRFGAQGSYDSLNPFIVNGTSASGAGFIYDSLTTPAADEPFSQYGLLAESITTPADRSWVEFTLRPEARWHDGVSVSVEDVIWTFNTLREQGRPFYRFYYGSVEKVEKTGERSVRFSFSPGENRELPLILGQLSILPKHYWEGRDFDKTTLEAPLGSGPYRISEVDAGRSIKLERVEDYWGKDLAVIKGQNNFGTISYDYYRDAGVLLEAFKAGEFDYRSENSSKAWATAYDFKAVHEGLLIQDTISHQRSTGMQGFAFNTRRDLFKDSRVRHALSYAFDFEWSNDHLFYGQYKRTRSYFDNSELAATGLPSAAELAVLEPYRGQIPDEVFTTEFSPPASDGSGNVRKNLRKAGKLLRDAGWTVKDGKRVNSAGQELAFEILLVSPLFERIVLPFTQNLEKLGVIVTVRTVDSAQYVRRLDTFDYDMIVHNVGQSLSPGNEQRSYWGSGAASMEGGRNLIGIQNAAIDGLIETLIAAPDRTALVTATRALDRVLQWGHWMIPQWHIAYDRIAYWDMFGRPDIVPTRGNQIFAWWVDPVKLEALNQKRSSSGG